MKRIMKVDGTVQGRNVARKDSKKYRRMEWTKGGKVIVTRRTNEKIDRKAHDRELTNVISCHDSFSGDRGQEPSNNSKRKATLGEDERNSLIPRVLPTMRSF